MSVITVGGLNIYDPNQNIGGNQFQSFGFGVNPDNNNVVNQEDLIMYCNLRAFTRPRSYILNSNSDGVKLQSVASARVNFLKPNPNKTKFTTDWTELDATGRPNGEEMLGINSVQITYDTSYIPRVTITMTDVRGQALNEDPGNSPYGSFFNFPYPMFVLEIKGYYGKAVKYLLHLLKYSSKFNYETGNFEITCEFVGFTYALLSDLNVQYGLVAAQMVIDNKPAKDILKQKFLTQKSRYPKLSEDIDKIINSNVYSLVDLINKSKDLNTLVDSLSQDNELFRKKAALESFIDIIQSLYDEINRDGQQTVRNNTFNERVLNINGSLLFVNFPEYNTLKCNVIAPNDTNFISDNVKTSYNVYFDKSKNSISQTINDIMKNIDGEVKKELTDALGFTPTINNIMLIICNNFELFLDLLTDTTKRAAIKRKNKLKQVNITKRFENKELEEIYPWPALYDSNYNICYFEDIPGLNISDYPEKEFVESYLNATAQTNKLLEFSGGTLTVSDEIKNINQFNPIHSQQYNNTKNPNFSKDLKSYLTQVVEHALLLSTNTWGGTSINQIQKFGERDAENLYNILGVDIRNDLTTLSNNLKWIYDSENNTTGNNPLGILQIISDNKTPINNFNNPFDDIKKQFQYITSDITSNYLTDIVETETITRLKDKYNNLNKIRFIPEITNNLLPEAIGGGYGDGSVTIDNNGFIYYEKNDKFIFPEEISLYSMFNPFMDKQSNFSIFNVTKLTDENLLTSLKSVLINLQVNQDNNQVFPDVVYLLNKTPGVLDGNKDFILFNGIHKTKMASALNYLFFNDDEFLNPLINDYRVLTKYRYYFPFTTPAYPKSIETDLNVYTNNYKVFLSVYREMIEKIIDIMKNAPTVSGDNVSDIDLYYDIASGGDNEQQIIKINKSGDPSVFSNQNTNKKQYSEIYSLIKEFFDADIQMVSKSNGLSDVYKNPISYWTNNNNWNEIITNNVNDIIIYNNQRYNRFNSGGIINEYLTGFKRKIEEIKKGFDNNTNPESTSKTTNVKTSSDIKKSLYLTFKNINDKWVIDDGDLNQYTWALSGDVDFNNTPILNNNRQYLFDHFFFVDRVNRDIGSDLLIDFRILKDYYDKVNSKNSLYSIIGELAKKNEMIFHPLTSYVNFGGPISNKTASVDGLFNPITTLDFQSSTPVFIMQYIGKNASYQYENQNHLPDVVKIDFSNDNPRFTSPEKSPFADLNNDNIVNTPVAFLVDVGIKNQNMFKGITLDQAEFRETNESITIWDQLTSQKENRSIQTIGNNIYPILSRRSYTCKVESLGNMMIQPTMYFYLRYIPLFSGLYLITKVSHSIQPNNIVTNFEGVRMSSLNFPLVNQFISTLSKEIIERGSQSSANITVREDINFWDNLSKSTNAGDILIKNRIITFYNVIKTKLISKEAQAAMIAIAYKESQLKPKSESSYATTTKFSSFNSFTNLKKYTTEGSNNIETSQFINELKKKDTTFFNFVYGVGETAKNLGNNPNTAKVNPIIIPDGKGNFITVYDDVNGDGYKYRGRGYNQITGKYNYEKVKKNTGVDVVTNPDLLNNIDTAALAMLAYFNEKSELDVEQSVDSSNPYYKTYNRVNLNNYNDYWIAYNTLFTINAGQGKSLQTHLNNDIQKNGYNKGYSVLQSIYRAIIDDKIK